MKNTTEAIVSYGPVDKPHFRKVAHFESLGLFPTMENNEWKRKIKLRGTTSNPDYYVPESDTYIEVVTSIGNITEQQSKWRRAMKRANVRVFWWEGEELTELIRDNRRTAAWILAAARENGKKGGRPRKIAHTSHTLLHTPFRHPEDSSENEG
jgi:hypothetical protein